MDNLFNKIKIKLWKNTELVRPVGWSTKQRIIKLDTMISILDEVAEEYGCPATEGCAGYKAESQTNADRIRSMSDEELAKFLDATENLGYRDESIAGHKDMLEWLQSEVELLEGGEN